MRKKLCFNCRDPWFPDHRCMGKGEIHYIEVAIVKFKAAARAILREDGKDPS
jgi:hypothetical protein